MKLLGKLFIPLLAISSAITAQDYLLPSYDPPAGLAVDSCPVFIVLGFDDNRYTDGMEWVLSLLENKYNHTGTGNPATFDGETIKAAFYHTSNALDEDSDGSLLTTWKTALDRGHEVANHTITHNTSKALSLEEWKHEIGGARTAIARALNIPESDIIGFRTPYLDFNDATFTAVNDLGMSYECTMTQMQSYNLGRFLWPYTLDEGFGVGVIAGWEGKSKIPGLWELPVYTIGEAATMWPPITGFDSSVLTQANGSKYAQMLKNGLDYRLQDGGNRAPYTIGLHSDTYAASNPAGANYDGALTLTDRQAALSDFIDYALTFPQVRFVTGVQLIEWLNNPTPLGRPVIVPTQQQKLAKANISSMIIKDGTLQLHVPQSGNYDITISNALGRALLSQKIRVNQPGCIHIGSSKGLSKGVHFYSIKGQNITSSGNFVAQ